MMVEDMPDFADRHPATVHLWKFFTWQHLPVHLQAISRYNAQLAATMINELPDGPELTAGLRKLLEAKDCFVRSRLG